MLCFLGNYELTDELEKCQHEYLTPPFNSASTSLKQNHKKSKHAEVSTKSELLGLVLKSVDEIEQTKWTVCTVSADPC